jgi:hypothetical protein
LITELIHSNTGQFRNSGLGIELLQGFSAENLIKEVWGLSLKYPRMNVTQNWMMNGYDEGDRYYCIMKGLDYLTGIRLSITNAQYDIGKILTDYAM